MRRKPPFPIRALIHMSHYGNLPDGWVEVSLGELFEIGSAKRVMKSDWQSEGIPFYRTREIVKLAENGDVNNDLFISHQLFDEMKTKFGVPQSGDIMLTAVGTIGIPYVVRESDLFYYKDASVLCLSNIYNLNSEFFKFVLLSQRLRKQMFSSSKGTTVDTITIEKASNYRVLLPPIGEQQRIVSAVDKIKSIIDWAESEQKNLTDLITIAKSKVLELAMQGKLVPQDPEDEPAAEMLRRVNPKARIICDTPHFRTLPTNWAFCQFKSVIKSPSTKPFQILQSEIISDGDIPVISQSANFIEGYCRYNEKAYPVKDGIVIFGDHTRIVKYYDKPFIVGADGVKLIEWNYDYRYLYYLTLHLSHKIPNRGYSRHFQYLINCVIGLPPTNEQRRIVSKIERIFSILDNIEASLQS